MRVARTLALGGIWTYLFINKILPFLQEQSDLPLTSFKTWHAQKKAFMTGDWRIDSLEDLTLFFVPIAVLAVFFVGWFIACRLPYGKIIGLFFKILGLVFKTTFGIKPRLVIHRKGIQKPIPLLPQFVGAKHKATAKATAVANSTQPASAAPSQKEAPATSSEPKEQNTNQTKLVNVRHSPILQEISNIAKAHGFRVFANLSMVDQKLPLSCAWRENAVLFNIIEAEGEDWVVEESDDCTEAQWFSGTSYMSSPCLPLLRIKEALLQKNKGLKVFCVLILAKGTVMDEDTVAETLNNQGVFFVQLNSQESQLPSLDNFFTQTFPTAGGNS